MLLTVPSPPSSTPVPIRAIYISRRKVSILVNIGFSYGRWFSFVCSVKITKPNKLSTELPSITLQATNVDIRSRCCRNRTNTILAMVADPLQAKRYAVRSSSTISVNLLTKVEVNVITANLPDAKTFFSSSLNRSSYLL